MSDGGRPASGRRRGVGGMQVIEDDRQWPRPGGTAEPGTGRAVQAEPSGGGVDLRRGVQLVTQQRREGTGELAGRGALRQ
jgi:hypothetical protein